MAKATSVQDRLLTMEEGELQTTLLQWLQANRFVVSGIVVIILLLLSGGLYWRHQKAVALDNLRTGISAVQGGDAPKALTVLQHVGGTALGNTERVLGLFYMGEAQRMLGKNDEAIKRYEEALVLLKRGKAGTYLEQVVVMKLAAIYAAKGMDAEARQYYEQAAGFDGPLKTDALAAAARLAEKMNDAAGAKTHYEKLATVEPTYPLAEVFQGKAGK